MSVFTHKYPIEDWREALVLLCGSPDDGTTRFIEEPFADRLPVLTIHSESGHYGEHNDRSEFQVTHKVAEHLARDGLIYESPYRTSLGAKISYITDAGKAIAEARETIDALKAEALTRLMPGDDGSRSEIVRDKITFEIFRDDELEQKRPYVIKPVIRELRVAKFITSDEGYQITDTGKQWLAAFQIEQATS